VRAMGQPGECTFASNQELLADIRQLTVPQLRQERDRLRELLAGAPASVAHQITAGQRDPVADPVGGRRGAVDGRLARARDAEPVGSASGPGHKVPEDPGIRKNSTWQSGIGATWPAATLGMASSITVAASRPTHGRRPDRRDIPAPRIPPKSASTLDTP
jgi:hypothetical protein